MCARKSSFGILREKVSGRRAVLTACGAVCSTAILSLFASPASAQTSYTWTSASSGNWSVGSNWAGNSAPAVDPNGDVFLEFNGNGTYTANNNLGPYYVYTTTFDSTNGPTTLSGGDYNLSWPLSEANDPAFNDDSTNPVTINNNLNFEAPSGVGGTVEDFVIHPGATVTINGNVGLTGGSGLKMYNGQSSGTGGPGGTMIWTQPVVFTNNPPSQFSGYFPFRIYEGTFIMGGYTIYNGGSDAPILNVQGVNIIQTNVGQNNGAVTDMYIGPEDYERGYANDVASFFLTGAGAQMNQPVQLGDAGTITIGGVNTTGTVYFNDFFKTLPTDGNGAINGVAQTFYFSAAAGGTVVQNFALVRGGGSGFCAANVEKVGPGTWVVAGGGDNDQGAQAYHGNTSVRDGTLELAYDDTVTNFVTLPAAALSNPNATYYSSGLDGGSLGYNAATNAVQLGDSGTLATDNIALLTLINSGAPAAPRQVLHNIQVNNFNPSGTTSIGVADNGVGNFSGNIAILRTVTLTSGTGGTANFSGNITGTGGLSVIGTGTVNLTNTNSYNGSTSIAAGAALNVGVAGALTAATAVTNNGVLNVNGNTSVSNISGTGTVNIGAASAASLVIATNSGANSVGALSITNGSKLDIANNHLLVNYGSGPDPITSITALLATGYAGGAWNGAGGIVSNAAAANSGSYGLGYADSADPGNPAGLATDTIKIAYTLLGDANLDYAVNGVDFGILAANFNKGITGWDKGDFNYDNAVNGVDFGLLAANFNKGANGVAVGPSALSDPALVAFAEANGLMADVPEPATIGLLCTVGVGLLHRRRRSLGS
jgi:hypothetical protein